MVTNEGYVRRTYEEILNAKIEKAIELFGTDINTDSNTPLGKYIRINAYDQYKVEEMAEKIYYSIFPQTASGQSLDRLGWTVGLTRKAATHAVYYVKLAGEVDGIVKSGFEVGTEAGLNFHNLVETTIGADGTCILTVECNEAGTVGNIDAKDIVKILNPAAHIIEIVASENALKSSAEDDESDYDFLKRYEIAREGNGSCNETSMLAALLNIPAVKDAYVKVTESAGEGDIPANSIACYIHGGDSAHQEIAEAIFEKKPIGVGTYGNISVSVSYGALADYQVKFSHAEERRVYISLALETDNTFDTTNDNGYKAIKKNIESFIQDLGIGKSLVLTAMYKAIYSVTGVVSAYITASTDGAAYTSDNIEIEPHQILLLSKLLIGDKEF